MKKFEAGKSYYTRSICNQDCIFAYTVAKRTDKTATLVDASGTAKRYKVRADGNTERIILGSYSMAPVLDAADGLQGAGGLRERVDEMHRAAVA